MAIGWEAEIRDSIREKPTYYGSPRVLTLVNVVTAITVGSFFQVPGTFVPMLVVTVPCAFVIHVWAAWMTWRNPNIFTILQRRVTYTLRGARIGRFDV